MEDLEKKLASLIVEALNLRISPDSIDPEAPLFSSGLGLDSIDALEIAVAIQTGFGVEIRANDENNVTILSSLRSLAKHITAETQNK
ncbi:MAG: phosphopantetheine-binding protein [Sedimenticola sp.]